MNFEARRKELDAQERQVREQATAMLNQIAGRRAELDHLEAAWQASTSAPGAANGHDVAAADRVP